MPEQSTSEWVTIGQVVALFGLRGDLKVRLLTDIPDRFSAIQRVFVGPKHLPYQIQDVRPYKGEIILLKLAGCDDANTAEALRNAVLQLPPGELATLPPGSYYQHDILGLQVYAQDGAFVGRIVDIITTGSNDVYVIKTEDATQVLIPAIKDVITQIDLQKRTMHIDPMPGLLDNSDRQDREQEREEE